MNKEMYNNLTEEEQNLANYFDAVKINSMLSSLTLEELLNIIETNELKIDTTNIDINTLKIKISQSLRSSFIETENIKKLENISLKMANTLYQKHYEKAKLASLKYKILRLLVNNDEALTALSIDLNLVDKKILNIILGNIAMKIGLVLDYEKINKTDIERLNKLADEYFKYAVASKNLTTNVYTYNLVNATNINVKKLAKQM